jgi:hypothetical protein
MVSSRIGTKEVIPNRCTMQRPSPPLFLLATIPLNLTPLIRGHLLELLLSPKALKPHLTLLSLLE